MGYQLGAGVGVGGGRTINDEHGRVFIPCIPVSFCPFPFGLLTIHLDSLPKLGAPSHVMGVNISYLDGLEFMTLVFSLAQIHPPSDPSLTPFTPASPH